MTRPIRICRVIARLNVGGPAVHIIQLTSGLDSKRFEQLVVCGLESPGEASMRPDAERAGLPLVVVPELGRELDAAQDLIALVKLYRLFRRWRPDIVETHTAKAGTLGRLAAFLAGVPALVHVFHGHVFHGYFSPARSRAFIAVEQALARISTRIIALGERQREEILGYGVGRPAQVVSVPLGFELGPLLDAAQHRGALRRELGLPEDAAAAPLIGIVGRLAPIKAHEVFFEAAGRVLERVPGAHFAVIGGGERQDELAALAARPPLAGRVHFLGWRDDKAVFFAGLDVLLLTSDNEGMPTAIIEAMAAGTPVVATAVGGVPELIQDGVSGLLAPRRDAVALAEGCVRLLTDGALRGRLAAAAQSAVMPRYDLSTLLETMTTFYAGLAPDAGD